VFAVRSAGITYAITKACADGLIRNCGCEPRLAAIGSSNEMSGNSILERDTTSNVPKSSWPWAGCSDNVEYGLSRTKQLLDVRLHSQPSDLSATLMTHNYNAGRQVRSSSIRSIAHTHNLFLINKKAVKENMRLVCKCHGVSGSCSVRSCWRRLSQFRQIGDWLKIRYDDAIRVQPANDGANYTVEHADSAAELPEPTDLVYADPSPNFCVPDPRLGSVGTRSRRCQPNSLQADSCDLLCCGRGYETVRQVQRFNCRCQFQWCCDVQCDQCERYVDVHICR
jgi:hypothetical protein